VDCEREAQVRVGHVTPQIAGQAAHVVDVDVRIDVDALRRQRSHTVNAYITICTQTRATRNAHLMIDFLLKWLVDVVLESHHTDLVLGTRVRHVSRRQVHKRLRARRSHDITHACTDQHVNVIVVECEVGEQRHRRSRHGRRRHEELEYESHQHDADDEQREERKEAQAHAEQRECARLDARATHYEHHPEQIQHRQNQLGHEKEREIRVVFRLVVLRIVERSQFLRQRITLLTTHSVRAHVNREDDERREPEEADEQHFGHVEFEQCALHGVLSHSVEHHQPKEEERRHKRHQHHLCSACERTHTHTHARARARSGT
jgi:hypothetical protein